MGGAGAISSKCIFCPNIANSGEHIWPRWMRDLLNRPWDIKRTETTYNYPRSAAPFGEVIQGTWNGATHHRKVYVVCESCNNGWMNQEYEIPARKFLEPMLKGDSILLDAAAQEIIARWFALKVLVIEKDPDAGQPPSPIFTKQSRLTFKRTGRIPDGFRIWIAARGGELWHSSLALGSGRVGASPEPGADASDYTQPGRLRNVQAATMGAGHLLLHTLAISWPFLAKRFQWTVPTEAFQIWPPSGQTVIWPPDSYLLDWACEDLSKQFSEFAKSTPRHPPKR